MLTLSIDTRGARRRFRIAAESLRDVAPVLREFDKTKRAKVQELFETGGQGKWEPRKVPREEQDLSQRAELVRASSVRSLRKTLIYDIKRAGGRVRMGKGKTTALLKRKAALVRFEEMVQAGRLNFETLAAGDKRFARRNARAIARYQGAEEIAGRLLGKIAQSIKSTVERQSLTIESVIPWAGVHNKGGRVGRGAELPARTFLEWTPEDLELLRLLLVERGIKAFLD